MSCARDPAIPWKLFPHCFPFWESLLENHSPSTQFWGPTLPCITFTCRVLLQCSPSHVLKGALPFLVINWSLVCAFMKEIENKENYLDMDVFVCFFFFFLSLKSNITHVHKQPVKVLTWYLPPPQKQWVFSKVIDVVSRFAVTCKNHSHTEFTKVLSSALKWKGMYSLLFKIIIIIIFNLAPA